MSKLKEIDNLALQPKKHGNSWFFKIKASKIAEKLIDTDKESIEESTIKVIDKIKKLGLFNY